MPHLKVKKDNYGFNWTFYIVDEDTGAVKDISGYTITLKVWDIKGSSLAFSDTCAITDGPNGVCTYTLKAADTDTEGTYYAELEMTKTGVIEDTETFEIYIRPTAPGA